MTLLTKPSRSYANVDHDSDGLSGVGTGTYADKEKVKSGKKLSKKGEGGFKTYRPPISETHLRKTLAYHDPNPTSHFAPLPSAFQSHRVKKEQALAGQRAEADHLLAPGYRSTHTPLADDAESSAAGARRTAGGLAGFERRSKAESGGGLGGSGRGLRPSASISSFSGPGTAGSGGGGSAGAAGRSAGVYLDSSGKLHDTEFDPFAGVSEMSRAKSRRRSAFGSDRRRGDESSSSSGDSEAGYAASRRSGETGRGAGVTREEEEIRRRLEADRKRMDDVSGYAARRRSIMSEQREQHGAGGSGRGSPSIRSSDDGFTSAYSFSLAPSARTGTRSQQGYYPSPLSPSFQHPPSASSVRVPPAEQALPAGEATPPEKSTEMTDHISPSPVPPTHPSRTMAPPRAKPKSKVEVKDGVTKIIGFDGPTTPLPTSALANLRVSQVRSPVLGSSSATADHFLPHPSYPSAPESARLSAAGTSRSSLDTTAPARSPRPPTRRDRDDIYPETPAQTKRRQERDQRRAGGHAALAAARERGLAIDTTLAEGGRGRVLPEIEIIEDDDPRIIFPKEGGKSTRVQTKHDHVIRGPFAHALSAQSQIGMGTASGSGGLGGLGGSRSGSGQMNGYGSLGDLASLTAPPPSHPSHPAAAGAGGTSMRSFGGSKPSSLMDDAGGYLPSRWASGDKALRLTEDEREKYRPREWGGKHGDLGGREDEWRPGTKDALKRNIKDIATNARFSLYRTKKKLLRKAEM